MATLTGSTFTDDQAGRGTLTATDADATTVTGSVGFTVSPLGVATSFAVATPSSPSAGVAFDETITALDAYGNTATGYTGDQTVTFAGPSSSPEETAPTYPATVAFAAGVGTAPITLFDAQSTELTATQGTITGSSGSFTVGAGAAAQLAFITEPASSSSGTVWGVQPTVAVEDAFGNTVSSSSAPVELTIDAPPAGSATLTCSTDPEEASGGVAGFTQCEITTTTSGDYTLAATSSGLGSATSGEIDIAS